MFFLNEESPLLNKVLSSDPVMSNGVFKFIYIFFIIIMIYFGISLLAAACVCKPEYSDDVVTWQLVIHIIGAVILLLSSIIFFAGVSHLNYKLDLYDYGYDDDYGYDYEYYFVNIQDINSFFNRCKQKIDNLYCNITKFDKHFTEIEKSLCDIENKIDSKSQNNLITNTKIKNKPKTGLKMKDSSKKEAISNILFLSKHYNAFTKTVKNQITSFKKKILQPTASLIQTLNTELSSYKIGCPFLISSCAFITATLILLVTIVYVAGFFFKNCCTRGLFSTFSLFALLILILGFVSGIFINENDYKKVMTNCAIVPYSASAKNMKIQNDINILMKDIIDSLRIFNDDSNFIFDIDNIFSANSQKNFKEYQSINSQYSKNHEYSNFLNDKMLTIKDDEIKITEIKKVIKDIKKFTSSVYPTFKEIQYDVLSLIEIVNETYNIDTTMYSIDVEKYCSKMHSGSNCCAVATIFLYIGLIIMSITVCIRRRGMSDYEGVSNSNNNNNNSNANSTPTKNIKVTGVQVGKKRMVVTDYVVNNVGLHHNGILGPGYYFTDSMGEAFHQMLKHNKDYVYNENAFTTFHFYEVDLGTVLIVPLDGIEYYNKEWLTKFGCDSVMVSESDCLKEFVVYDPQRITLTSNMGMPDYMVIALMNNNE